MVERGLVECVLDMRGQLQSAMEDELTEAVERAPSRKVVAVMSCTHLDPDDAAEVSILDQAVEPA